MQCYSAAVKRTLQQMLSKLPAEGRERVLRVSRLCDTYLKDVRRRNGDNYAEHCHSVASVLTEITEDPSLITVALIHDIQVHPKGQEILDTIQLSADERRLVNDMHELRRLHIDEKTKDLDRVMEAFASDPRLLWLRMAHRLNDVRQINTFSKKLQKQIGLETLHMYAAIAGRLSLHAWRHEMEDVCFHVVQPDIAASLEHQFSLHHVNDERCLTHVRGLLLRNLRKNGITADITYRTKALYSTYRKMVVKRYRFHELADRLAVRVLVGTLDDCYRALGIIHNALHPIPGKLKDYIGAPKENGYRSIHTVVYPIPGTTEYPVEIQIRTHDMHRECEYGSAHHADYKHSLYAFNGREAHVDLFSNLFMLREAARTPDQFERALRNYFDESRITVFDSKNNLYHFPLPIAALDVVCHLAGDRSKYLRGIRINGRSAPPDALLKDGDTIEPQFGRRVLLKPAWLKACRKAATKRLLKKLLEETV